MEPNWLDPRRAQEIMSQLPAVPVLIDGDFFFSVETGRWQRILPFSPPLPPYIFLDNRRPVPFAAFPPPTLPNNLPGPVAHNNNVARVLVPVPQPAIPQPAPRPAIRPGTISPRQGKKNFPCTHCDEKFIDNRRRARHLAAQHGVGEADTKECSVEGCGHKGRSDNVRRHEKLKHGMHKHA